MNPVAFEIFGFSIRYYSLFIMLGVIIAYLLIKKEVKRFELSEDAVFNIFFYTIIIGIVGARLYYVMFNWDYFGGHMYEIWQLWEGGLAIHGGIIFGILTLTILCKKYDIDVVKMLDISVVPLILAQAIGRWGNFFNQEAYGVATSLEHLQKLHIPKFVINGMNINGFYYTPTFLYESIWCLIGFAIMLVYRRTKFVKNGQILSFYLIWYGVGRFFIEKSRTDSLMFLGFKIAQIVSLIMIAIGIIIFLSTLKKSKYEDLYNYK